MPQDLMVPKAARVTILLGTDRILRSAFEAPETLVDASAIKARDELLEESGYLERVVGEDSQEMAANSLSSVQKMISVTEKDRKTATAPFNAISKKIMAEAKEFSEPLEIEKKRLQTLLGQYQEKLVAEQREQERKAEAERQRIEAERRAAEEKATQAIRDAKTEADVANAKAEAEMRAAELNHEAGKIQVSVAATGTGTAAREEWQFEVLDLAKIFKDNRELLDISIKRGLVKQKLDQLNPDGGFENQIPGIKAWKETVVRATGR